MFLFTSRGWCQPQGNPFELSPRLTPEQRKEAAQQAQPAAPQGNPFDIVPPSPDAPRGKRKKAAPPPLRTNLPKGAVTKEHYKGFLLTAVMISLLFFTLLMTLQRNVFVKSYRAMLNDNLLNQVYRERAGGMLAPYVLAYSLFFVNGGLFIYLVQRHFQLAAPMGHFQMLLICIGLVATAFVLKHLVLAIIGGIFPIEKETSLYSFAIMIFGIILGLVLIPFNLAIAYAPEKVTRNLIYISFGIIGAIYLLRLLRGLFIANKFLIDNKFHFLLYICSVEAAPLLVLIKIFNDQIGIG